MEISPRFKTASLWLVAAVIGLCILVGCTSSPEGEWPPPTQKVDTSEVLSPEEALQSFSVPPNFRVELVAAEPLVVDPVAIDIDPDGRLWAVEMHGWMRSLLPSEEADRPRGKIVALEDTNGDGRMDERTVFLDSLNLPRGVLVLQEGVLVAEPPHLWLAKDRDGDLKADTTIEVRGDYGDPAGNPEAMANSPTWGMDNWIHSTHYPGRLRLREGSFQYDSTLAVGQWGLAMDDYGRFYRSWNADPLFAAMLDPHYFDRNPHMVETSGADVSIATDSARKVWPIRSPTWVNRGYRESVLRKNRTLRTFTSASGPAAYRGETYPESFRDDVFVPEPAAHLVRRFAIQRHDDGTLEATNAYDKTEFMLSTDERFRPVNLYPAPDGTLYVVDMYQGVIEHRNFLSQYLKAHIQEEGLLKPYGMGRIYRVVYEPNPPRREPPQLTTQSDDELVERLAHPNGWWRDAAQQLLVERGASGVAPALREMTRSHKNELARLHALWTLEGVEALDLETLRDALSDASPHVRAAAVRLSEPWLRDGNSDVLQEVATLIDDSAPEVRLQLAASLGEVPPPAADSVLVRLLSNASAQPYLTSAVVSGLKDRELAFLRRLVGEDPWTKPKAGRAQVLQTLAATIVNAGTPDTINRMVRLIGDEAALPRWQRLALLSGIEERIPDGERRPLRLKHEPPALAGVLQASDSTVRAKARQVADQLVWPGKAGYEPREATLVTAEQKQWFATGKQVYQQTCTTCHQSDGRGQEGVAPSLVGARWVLGQRKDAIRIVLDGKKGDVGLMPPEKDKLSNEEIAAVLTYVRNAWGNQESPVSPALVEEVRNATAVRDRPWTDEELRVMLH